MFLKCLWQTPVPKRDYDALLLARDVLLVDNQRLMERLADLTGQCSVLGLNEAVARQLAEEALILLATVDTRRTGGTALQRKIDDLLARARRMGLLQEKSEGEG